MINSKQLMMFNNTIVETHYGETRIVGKITCLEKYFIEVEILVPFVNWKDRLSINGIGRMSPYNFLQRYEEVAEKLLVESYRKLAIIDQCIDRAVGVYENLLEEIEETNKIENELVRKRIQSKLEDWFLENFLFTSSITGLIASYYEREVILNIITTYKKNKRKIYMSEVT